MPIYKYRCLDCDHKFEVERGMNEVLEIICPICDSDKIKQVFTVPAIQFNCDGFHCTDYGKYKSRWDEERKIKREKKIKNENS